MGILDNSGDIILDTVLTDAGRERAARGDGSFNIVKFAAFDDEINYSQYNPLDSRGSSYYDLDIMQTPIFEAISDNGATAKHKLISIPRNDLLYLPVVKLNEITGNSSRRTVGLSTGVFVVAVNKETEDQFGSTTSSGLIRGVNPGGVYIQADQGLDTTEISFARSIDDNLLETRYIIEIDNRFGSIISTDNSTRARPAYIDDDNIASYNLSLGNDVLFVGENTNKTSNGLEVISGPRGSTVKFRVLSSMELESSVFLFEELGSTMSITAETGNITVYYIDTNVRVIGATTGRSIEIPVRYIRKQ